MHVAAVLGAAGLALCGCVQKSDSRTHAVDLDSPSTGRLGMRANLTLSPAALAEDGADWLVITPGGPDGPNANPDGVMGASGQIDLNGDGVAETVQARLGGAGWSEFAVFDSDRPDAKVLFRGEGVELLVSKARDAAGWPVLATLVRDYQAPRADAQKVTPDRVWTGEAYSDQPDATAVEAP